MSNENVDVSYALTPLVQRKQEEARQLIDRVVSIQISSADGRDSAALDLMTIKSQHKELDGMRKELVGPLNAQVKAINDLFRDALEGLKGAESTLKQVIGKYDREVKEKARKEAEEAARKAKAAAERKAKAADKRGDEEAADAVRQEAEMQAAAIKAQSVGTSSTGKIKGVSSSEVVDFVVEDKAALIKAVAAGSQPATLLEVNEQVVRKLVSALGEECRIPGIRVFKKSVMRARAL